VSEVGLQTLRGTKTPTAVLEPNQGFCIPAEANRTVVKQSIPRPCKRASARHAESLRCAGTDTKSEMADSWSDASRVATSGEPQGESAGAALARERSA